MSMRNVILTIVILAAARPVIAQNPQQRDDSPFGKYLFPPEMVMSNQQAIGLQDAQKTKIMNELRTAQGEFMDIQMKMGVETESLSKLLQAASVDETAVLAQVDRILEFERQIKKRQVGLLVRIRNTLTAQQRTQLASLRQATG